MSKIQRVCEGCNTIFSPDDPFNAKCPKCNSTKVKPYFKTFERIHTRELQNTGKCPICQEKLIRVIETSEDKTGAYNKQESIVTTHVETEIDAFTQGQSVIWVCKKCESIIGVSSIGVIDSEKFRESGMMHMLSFFVAENVNQSLRR